MSMLMGWSVPAGLVSSDVKGPLLPSDYACFLEVAFHRLNPGSLTAVSFSLPNHAWDKSVLAISEMARTTTTNVTIVSFPAFAFW